MDVKTHAPAKGARTSRFAAVFDDAYYAQNFNDFSGRVFGTLGKALSGAVLIALAAVVLTVLSIIGWLYGVWQNHRLSGMPLAGDSQPERDSSCDPK